MVNNCKNCGLPLSAHGGGRMGFAGCEEFEELIEEEDASSGGSE